MTINWKEVLVCLVKDREAHGRFINTISLMEYMGARKIVKSQLEQRIDSEVLAHMTEEIRHAQIFKKMALKISQGQLKTYADEHLLAGAEGRAYIQAVDQSVAAVLRGENSRLNYQLSTLLIEERANSVYPFYAELMEPFGFGGQLRAILREEEHHLEQIKEGILRSEQISATKLEALRIIEHRAFEALMEAVASQIGMNPPQYGESFL